jgi:phi13 family phage major tail protein
MGNKIRYGLKNVHVAFRAEDDSSGAPVWDAPIAIPGAIGFKRTAEGDEVKIYADNGVYFSSSVNNGYSAELETALIPDAVLAAMLKMVTDTNGVVVEDADALAAPFALMGQIEGDSRGRRFVCYECRASRPEPEHKTKQATIEPTTDVIKLQITPIAVGGVNTPMATIEDDPDTPAKHTLYTNWFQDVYVPSPAA